MEIREVKRNIRAYMDILFLADEQEDMIDRYLDRGTMFVLEDDGVKAECVVTDEKPITARQCIQALPEIAAARPTLTPRIRRALERADLTGYRDSMRPLLLRDIVAVLKQLP